jgi:hypothetical protein
MKKLIPLLVLLLGGTSAALAQGTVLFDNAVLIGHQNVTDPYVLDVDGTRLKNPAGSDTLRVQLLYGPSAGSLTAHTALARFRTSAATTFAGTWRGLDASDDLNRALTGGGVGVPVIMRIRAWDATAAGLGFDAARLAGQKWGESALFTYTQRASSPADPSDVWMVNFEGFSLVPEPSVIGLAMVGVGALFMLRRRKAS